MKKILLTLSFMLTMTVGVFAQQNAGQLKVYVANKSTVIYHEDADYKEQVSKGHLIAEVTDDDSETTVSDKENKYVFETVSNGEQFSVSKADVEMKTYDITPLPVSMIGNGLHFVSNDGLKARVFKSNSNGHRYANSSYAKELGISLNSCYVLSMECLDENGSKMFVENPVAVKNGKILSNAYFPVVWASGQGFEKSSYDQAGRLLYNQRSDFDGMDYVVAYIGSENALYLLGKLYYCTTDTKTSATAEPAAPQTLDNLPLDEIFKFIDQSVSSDDLLAALNYKYVGEYVAGRGYQNTWCRNCTCNKRGDVLSFQKGTSSIICISESMGSGGATLSLEVFNTSARDAVLDALNKMGFKEESSNASTKSFSRDSELWGQIAGMQKSKKGWLFTVWPIAADTE